MGFRHQASGLRYFSDGCSQRLWKYLKPDACWRSEKRSASGIGHQASDLRYFSDGCSERLWKYLKPDAC
jgi:hypothetical protein